MTTLGLVHAKLLNYLHPRLIQQKKRKKHLSCEPVETWWEWESFLVNPDKMLNLGPEVLGPLALDEMGSSESLTE